MKAKSKPTLIAIALLIVTAAVSSASIWARHPAHYDILDSRFGPSAWQPAKLLDTLSWPYRDNNQNPFGLGFPEFFDFQHQALLRLIDIQEQHFGHPAPPRNQQGTYIDHSLAYITQRTDSRVIVIGTATLKPCHYDDRGIDGPEGYWQMERFTFAPTGELLSREAYTSPACRSQ